MRIAVSVVTCRVCGRICSLTVPRAPADPEEVSHTAPSPCSPAFAQWASCPEHPPGPPDVGPYVDGHPLRYSDRACPLLWEVRVVEVPGVERV